MGFKDFYSVSTMHNDRGDSHRLHTMNFLFNLFFPRRCAICRRADTPLCAHCFSQLKSAVQKCPLCCRPSVDGITHVRCFSPHALRSLTSLWTYHQPEVRKVIKAIKYHFDQRLIDHLFKKMKLAKPPSVDFIIPLPLHPRRQNWRGFNQAYTIATHLSAIWNIPLLPALTKVKSTKPLAAIKDRLHRKDEIKHSFQILPQYAKQLKNHTVLLVDDVFTSGATMREAAKTLKKVKLKQIHGWTLAN